MAMALRRSRLERSLSGSFEKNDYVRELALETRIPTFDANQANNAFLRWGPDPCGRLYGRITEKNDVMGLRPAQDASSRDAYDIDLLARDPARLEEELVSESIGPRRLTVGFRSVGRR